LGWELGALPAIAMGVAAITKNDARIEVRSKFFMGFPFQSLAGIR